MHALRDKMKPPKQGTASTYNPQGALTNLFQYFTNQAAETHGKTLSKQHGSQLWPSPRLSAPMLHTSETSSSLSTEVFLAIQLLIVHTEQIRHS